MSTRSIITLATLLASPFLCPVAWAADPFSEPLEKIQVLRAEHLVAFRTIGINPPDAQGNQSIEIELRTRDNVRLYTKGLRFEYGDSSGLPNPLTYTSTPQPKRAYDNWYREEREFLESGSVLTLKSTKALNATGKVRVFFEACSAKICLMPTWFALPASPGSRGVPEETTPDALNSQTGSSSAIGNMLENQPVHTSPAGPAHPQTMESPKPVLPVAPRQHSASTLAPTQNPQPKIAQTPASSTTPLQEMTRAPAAEEVPAATTKANATNGQVAAAQSFPDFQSQSFFAEALKSGGLLLFGALFLAGLLMNLTPCVYPMIPITLNVLGRFGTNASPSRRKFLPLFYVLGMIAAYSTMGVVAAMTGTIFGSLLQSTGISIGIALVMAALGLTMIGVFDLSRVQNLGNKIPLTENHPSFGVLVMGAVSGLVSAPCTGPVLASLLLLISQSRDPWQGFLMLSVFSFGFGFPYLILGSLTQKMFRMPRLGVFTEIVKLVFASLMFALSLYYLKRPLDQGAALSWLYARPSFPIIAGTVVVAILSAFAAVRLQKGHRIAWACNLIATTCLALWLTLFSLRSFHESSSAVIWERDWSIAVLRAQQENKPLLVDVWADWCAACKEMDATVWNQAQAAEVINKRFVALKIDYTVETPELAQRMRKVWHLSGLPAVGIYPAGSAFDAAPPQLLRGKVELSELLGAVEHIGH